eukprot:TRINITY_DN8317_c0_g1_i1.p1 TRINITY_DN8317_c0_g1~~TRINITY_DN8317_c0_g1_i1.p1  ORF type:complete len:430 (+),score=26.01 TRINITY_DN8317_c0_g1_i1:37-1326(+)
MRQAAPTCKTLRAHTRALLIAAAAAAISLISIAFLDVCTLQRSLRLMQAASSAVCASVDADSFQGNATGSTKIDELSARLQTVEAKWTSTAAPLPNTWQSPQLSVETPEAVVWLTTFVNSKKAEVQKPHLCSVAQNIWHPQIAQVVLLTEDLTVSKGTFSEIPELCRATGSAESRAHLSKLTIIRTEAQPTYYDFFASAASRFSGQLVVIANGDVYPGSAWPSTWTPAFFRARNLAIAWTRSPAEKLCRQLGYGNFEQNLCHDNTYLGSHDAFMFVPALDAKFMQALYEKRCRSCPQKYSFSLNRWGAENIVIKLLRKEAGLNLVNPCKKLPLMHLHCERNHTAPSERLNTRPGEKTRVYPKEFPATLWNSSAVPAFPGRLQQMQGTPGLHQELSSSTATASTTLTRVAVYPTKSPMTLWNSSADKALL